MPTTTERETVEQQAGVAMSTAAGDGHSGLKQRGEVLA